MNPPTMQDPRIPPAQQKISPEMPRIPGVPQKRPPEGFQLKPLLMVILAALLCASGFALWLSWRNTQPGTSTPVETSAPDASAANRSPRNADPDPNIIGTLYELAAPWSSKKFLFVDQQTHQGVPAMIIHLPSPPAEPTFWAFALTNPFSRCELQYVTDLTALSQHFAYPAAHPMIVSDCDGVLYDPLKIATLPDGSWVRGDIVRGGGIRPPINIQVEIRGRDLVAKRIEGH